MIPRTKVSYRLSDLLQTVFSGSNEGNASRTLARRLGELLGQPNVLLTSSGRSALHVLLSSLPHTTVVIPSYTCNAVVEAALLADKQVVYAETEEDGFNMDSSMLAPLLGPDVAVVATHQFGIPCNIEEVVRLVDALARLWSRTRPRRWVPGSTDG